MAESVIITCAVTGAIHTPTMSEYLPITPNEIAESAIAAAKRVPRSSISMHVMRIAVQLLLNKFM